MSDTSTVIDISVELQKAAAFELNPEDWRDEARALAELERVTPLELVRRRVSANHEVSALRVTLRWFGELLAQRVVRSSQWLDAKEAAAMLGLSTKALYCRLERDPTGEIARASTRLGKKKLRFSRQGLEAMLSRRPLRSARSSVPMRPSGVPSRRNGV